MYEEHWGLRVLPFDNTPNPDFFYASNAHREALSRMEYLVRERKACGVLTGVYGCGKTSVLHALLRGLGGEGNRFSLVTNPRLDALGLIRMILHGFKRGDVSSDKADVLMAMEDYVTGVANDGKHSVVVVDEAHTVEDDKVFEELRLLMNLQTDTRFLLTLLLAGQPELASLVEANKQLNQRVAMRFHLGPFSFEDTRKYVLHRLSVAGHRAPESVFEPRTLKLIFDQSGGIPRWINHICHLSLLLGSLRQAGAVSPEMAEEAIRSLAGAA